MNNRYNNSQIGVVSNFSDLVNTNFQGEMNAICWDRNLDGDFKEIVTKLHLKDAVTEIFPEDLFSLQLLEQGNVAREIIINDYQLLKNVGALPVLNLIKNYARDEDFDFITTDVYSFHVDRSPIETDTFLCTYYGASSDIIANNEVDQKILIPEIRNQLKKLHQDEQEDFDTFLKDNYFDLHYQEKKNAQPINLGLGHLWRLAVDHPKQQVLPCVHRAPKESFNEYRLLLIC